MSRFALVLLKDNTSITVPVEDNYNVDLVDGAEWVIVDEKEGGQLIVPAALITYIQVAEEGGR